MNFWHLVRVVLAKKWIILGLVAATEIVVLIAAPRPKVMYEATCSVAPTAQAMRGGTSSTTNSSTGVQVAPPDRNVMLSNLVYQVKTPDVLRRAMDFLAMPIEEQGAKVPELKGRCKQIKRIMYSPDRPVNMASDWADILQASPYFNPAVGEKGTTTDIITIRIKMPNGEDAPYIANAIAVGFMDQYTATSQKDTRKSIEFLVSSKEDARKKLRAIEAQIAAYKRQHKVVAADSETQNAVATLASLESARNSAQAEVNEAEAALKDIDRQLAQQPLVSNQALPADMNPKIARLKEELAQAEA